MPNSQDQSESGHAIYTPKTLALYNLLVLGISNRAVWKCTTGRLLNHYNKYVSANHLDVGVGTGYFLQRCCFPSPTPRIALMDVNSNSLSFAADRIRHYQPELYRHDVLEPIPPKIAAFDSIGLNYLLHCLPGSMESKSIVFDHLTTLLNPTGVIFGSTLLQGDDIKRSWIAKSLMQAYNRKGIFSNERDTLSSLSLALRDRFQNVSINVEGCVAIFACQTSPA